MVIHGNRLKAAQQGKGLHGTKSAIENKCTQSDINLLVKYGIDELRKMQYFGVIDRLAQAGML